MKPDTASAIHLLHRTSFGALATQASRMPGYPFATALPFVLDERHCPVFLLSGLAEHTKNLLENPKASLLVTDPDQPKVLESPRMTIVGDVQRFDATLMLQARYVRYQPDAAQYLELGDFAFFRLVPKRVRYIGGFAQMGWLEEEEWGKAEVLDLEDEVALLQAQGQAGTNVLGLDCYGIDLLRNGHRERIAYQSAVPPEVILSEAKRLLG
ncbi:HugZ family protein [Noviherbaspirillum sp. ST9]|uniref:HugZ family pyridoxamine 5'-phosphate oxidase n=1 Tax=Noviherbaspirillum sp. ST9 TaxID=3401606 RepID=UPI003B589886